MQSLPGDDDAADDDDDDAYPFDEQKDLNISPSDIPLTDIAENMAGSTEIKSTMKESTTKKSTMESTAKKSTMESTPHDTSSVATSIPTSIPTSDVSKEEEKRKSRMTWFDKKLKKGESDKWDFNTKPRTSEYSTSSLDVLQAVSEISKVSEKTKEHSNITTNK